MLVLPFNFKAANTYQGNGATSTYTVAVNHHALMTVTLSSNILHNSVYRDSGNNYAYGYAQRDCKVETKEFWLKPLDAVAFTVSVADSDTNNSIGGGSAQSDTLIVTMTINGNAAFRVKSKVSTYVTVGNETIRSTIFSDITWHAAEFLHS